MLSGATRAMIIAQQQTSADSARVHNDRADRAREKQAEKQVDQIEDQFDASKQGNSAANEKAGFGTAAAGLALVGAIVGAIVSGGVGLAIAGIVAAGAGLVGMGGQWAAKNETEKQTDLTREAGLKGAEATRLDVDAKDAESAAQEERDAMRQRMQAALQMAEERRQAEEKSSIG